MDLNLDPNSEIIIGCIPIVLQDFPPADYKNPFIGKCENCDKDIWMSEKKKQVKLDHPKAKCLCMFCCAKVVATADKNEFTVRNIGEGKSPSTPGEDLEM